MGNAPSSGTCSGASGRTVRARTMLRRRLWVTGTIPAVRYRCVLAMMRLSDFTACTSPLPSNARAHAGARAARGTPGRAEQPHLLGGTQRLWEGVCDIALPAACRAMGVMATASCFTGLASQDYAGGTTPHRLFKLPVADSAKARYVAAWPTVQSGEGVGSRGPPSRCYAARAYACMRAHIHVALRLMDGREYALARGWRFVDDGQLWHEHTHGHP